MVIEVATAVSPAYLPSGAACVVGVDLGGTKLAAILVDGDATVRHQVWLEHRVDSYPAALDVVTRAVEECRRAAGEFGLSVTGVGVAVAGPLDRDRTRVLAALNLGFANQPMRDDLARRLSVVVRLENDANAAAFAEYRFGAARGARSLVLLSLGTGIGGGVVIDGQVVAGAHGAAAELGHLTIEPDGEPCPCGAHGCLERYASGSAIARQAGTSSRRVVTAATSGDPVAARLLNDAGDRIGRAVAMLTPIIDPDVVLLAGGLAYGGAAHLLPPIRSALARSGPFSGQRPPPEVRLAACGPQGSAIGAAELVRLAEAYPSATAEMASS